MEDEFGTYFVIFLIGALICFTVAELFGRSKHIGRWWSFGLLITGLFIGIIAIIVSPSAKSKPTIGAKNHKIWGWIVLIIGLLNLFILNPLSISFIVLGLYLIKLSKGEIINREPKYYFSEITKNIPNPLHKSTSRAKIKNFEYLYYIVENDKQSEPYTFDQLKEKHIIDDTLLWRNGLENWTKAKDLKEIEPLIYKAPPPIPPKVIIEDKYVIGNRAFTLSELKKVFEKGIYLFGRDDKIKLVINDDFKAPTLVTLQDCEPLQQFLQYFPPKN